MNKEISRREMIEEIDNMLKYSTDAEVARLYGNATHTPVEDIEILRKQYEEDLAAIERTAEQGYREAYEIICEQRNINEQLKDKIADLQQSFRLLKSGKAIDLNALAGKHNNFINSVEVTD